MRARYVLLSFICCYQLTGQTAGDVINLIKENVTCEWRNETVDHIKVGSEEMVVTGIATTFMATMDVLQQAVEENCNLIITHEPTFYNHFDQLDPLKNDQVQSAKLQFIQEHDLTVFRFHDHIHMTSPDGITEGIIQKLNWKSYQKENSKVLNIPKTTLKVLANQLATTFDSDIIRVVGDQELEVSTVKLILGAAGSQAHFNAFINEEFDVLIIGEAREWETIPYFKDAATLGMKKGLIVLGHADSEEAGMQYCADWMTSFIKNIPIKFIPAKNPFWTGEKK